MQTITNEIFTLGKSLHAYDRAVTTRRSRCPRPRAIPGCDLDPGLLAGIRTGCCARVPWCSMLVVHGRLVVVARNDYNLQLPDFTDSPCSRIQCTILFSRPAGPSRLAPVSAHTILLIPLVVWTLLLRERFAHVSCTDKWQLSWSRNPSFLACRPFADLFSHSPSRECGVQFVY